jgi:hypothetical protein
MNDSLDRKIREHFDRLFEGVGSSQALYELKEELVTNLKEKIADYRDRGMDEDQAFREAVISMGDLGGLVEDMRRIGQDEAKRSVYSARNMRLSTASIVAGTLLVLFGMFTSAMLYFMNHSWENSVDPAIFSVGGGALIVWGALTRETRKKFGMTRIRAGLYALATGLLLFSLYSSVKTALVTKDAAMGVSSMMVFFLPGIGLWLGLVLTGTDRRKA